MVVDGGAPTVSFDFWLQQMFDIINLQKGNIYLGSEFWRFQSAVISCAAYPGGVCTAK